MWDALYALGRVAVVVIFLALGVNMLMSIDSTASLVSSLVLSKLPAIPVSAQIVGAAIAGITVIAGLLVLFGYFTRSAAFVLLIGTMGYMVFINNLWTMEAVAKVWNQSHALNLSLIGALLMLTAIGPGRLSVDGRKSESRGMPV